VRLLQPALLIFQPGRKRKNIVLRDEFDDAETLEKIKLTPTAQYLYEFEDESNPLRIGLIAEDAPPEVLSANGGGVDLYKLATFTFSGLKALAHKVEALELSVADLEANLANIGNAPQQNGISMDPIITYLASLGTKIMDGIAYFKNIVVGSPDKPTGITLYDTATGEPYCLQITNGVPVSIPGECGIASGAEATLDTQISTTTPTTSDLESPIISINGNNPAEIDVGSTYSDAGVVVTDNVNDNLGYSISVDGIDLLPGQQVQIDTTMVGEHTIIYTAIDQAGNTATATRIVNVIDSSAAVGATATTTPEIIETPSAASTATTTSATSTSAI